MSTQIFKYLLNEWFVEGTKRIIMSIYILSLSVYLYKCVGGWVGVGVLSSPRGRLKDRIHFTGLGIHFTVIGKGTWKKAEGGAALKGEKG